MCRYVFSEQPAAGKCKTAILKYNHPSFAEKQRKGHRKDRSVAKTQRGAHRQDSEGRDINNCVTFNSLRRVLLKPKCIAMFYTFNYTHTLTHMAYIHNNNDTLFQCLTLFEILEELERTVSDTELSDNIDGGYRWDEGLCCCPSLGTTVRSTVKPQRLWSRLNACGVPATVTLRDRVIAGSVEMLGGAWPVTWWWTSTARWRSRPITGGGGGEALAIRLWYQPQSRWLAIRARVSLSAALRTVMVLNRHAGDQTPFHTVRRPSHCTLWRSQWDGTNCIRIWRFTGLTRLSRARPKYACLGWFAAWRHRSWAGVPT